MVKSKQNKEEKTEPQTAPQADGQAEKSLLDPVRSIVSLSP